MSTENKNNKLALLAKDVENKLAVMAKDLERYKEVMAEDYERFPLALGRRLQDAGVQVGVRTPAGAHWRGRLGQAARIPAQQGGRHAGVAAGSEREGGRHDVCGPGQHQRTGSQTPHVRAIPDDAGLHREWERRRT